MADDSRPCPSCGARVPASADRCDLCGTPIAPEGSSSDNDATGAEEPSTPSPSGAPQPDAEGPASADRVFCHQCGHDNPADANYCSRCGAELEDLSDETSAGTRTVEADLPGGRSADEESAEDSPADSSDERAAVGRQLLFMVGIGLALVLGFFFVTQWSRQYDWGGTNGGSGDATATAPANGDAASSGGGPQAGRSAAQPETKLTALVDELGGAVDGPVADEIDSVRTALDAADGEQARQLRAQLVRLYIGAGNPGRAALVQRRIADATGAVADRRRAADLLYRWMRQVEQEQGRARVADVARHVASAYEAVADQRQEDLDARTRMGEAYLLTNNPMKGIQTINAVLKDDSTFVPARFQKALALLQINRLDRALRQFEAVQRFAESGDPFYKQAGRAIEVIKKEQARSSGEEASR